MLRQRVRGARPPEEVATEWYEPGPPPPGAPVDEPPPERDLWPWLLVLLVLVLAGLAAAWFVTHDSKGARGQQTTVTTVTAPTRPVGAGQVTVPAIVGMKVPQALETLRQAGFQPAVSGVFSDQPRGTVVSQTPPAQTKVAKGSTVQLRASKGPPGVVVPDLVGQRKDDAVKSLKALGLTPDVNDVPSTDPKDTVVAQHPAGGTKVAAESGVLLNISAGKAKAKPKKATASATVTVPDVTGSPLGSARAQIRSAGLVTEIRHVPSSQPHDTVTGQSPAAGTTAKRGDHVFLTVSLGPAKSTDNYNSG